MIKTRQKLFLGTIVFALILSILTYKLYASHEPYQEIDYDEAYRLAQQKFIESVGVPAKENYRETRKVLPSIVIAQAILESGWGQSDLTVNANNLFGIKGNHDGQSYNVLTIEFVDGEMIEIFDDFRKYDTLKESIDDHLDLLSSKYYTDVFESTNYIDAAYALQSAGYATDPNYAKKVIELVDEFYLYNYDFLD